MARLMQFEETPVHLRYTKLYVNSSFEALNELYLMIKPKFKTMEITIKHFGASRLKPAKIIELTVSTSESTTTVDVTDLHGKVDESLITNLKDIVNELEEQNKLISEQNQNLNYENNR